MKTSDRNVDYLNRSLRDEATSLRKRARRLDNLASQMSADVKSGVVTAHSFEYVAQEAIDLITHRSNVFPQTIARLCASLAAEAAVEWVKAEPARLHAEHGHVCSGVDPNCGMNPCIEHQITP